MKFQFPFLKHAFGNLFSKPSTVNFPKVNVDAKPGYRGRIAYYPDKCVNCGMCIKVCGPIAITRTSEDVPEGEKITYEFDLTSCTFCGMCQDFCSTKAIEMTPDYHMVATDVRDLIVTGSRIKEKVAGKLTCSDSCVYCTLCAKKCPEGAITVDREAKTWSVDEEKCVKCGICIDKCPKKSLSFAEVEEGVVCSDSCVYCTLCAKKCPSEAITVDRANKTWSIDREKCTKCGICISACPKKSLSMGDINASVPCPEAADVPAPTKVEPKAEEAAPAEEKAEAPSNNGKLTCSDSCVYCTLCAKKCPAEAITVDREAKTWAVDEEKCIKCGVCVEKCPKKSLSFEE